MAVTTRNVFVSHHHKDDASVDGLTRILKGKDLNIRNSSIRVKPENQKRINQEKVSEATIKRLLRMKMRWASQLIVVVGKQTHQRQWVNWEIEQAHKLGMPIIGVYESGLNGKVAIPENLENYGSAVVPWRADSVIKAIDGKSIFQTPDGEPAARVDGGNVVC